MNLPNMADVEIWAAFKNGDKLALSYIYSEYSTKLYWYGLKITSDCYLVEDSIQDLFSELIKNSKKLGVTDNIQYYLLKSFRRLLVRKLQKEKRIECSESLDGNRFDVVWSVEHNIIAEETDKQKSELLLSALNKLTPRQKEAIYLRFTKELDYGEIADVMEISVEACRNKISQAIQRLKRSISVQGHNLAVLFQLTENYPLD